MSYKINNLYIQCQQQGVTFKEKLRYASEKKKHEFEKYIYIYLFIYLLIYLFIYLRLDTTIVHSNK